MWQYHFFPWKATGNKKKTQIKGGKGQTERKIIRRRMGEEFISHVSRLICRHNDWYNMVIGLIDAWIQVSCRGMTFFKYGFSTGDRGEWYELVVFTSDLFAYNTQGTYRIMPIVNTVLTMNQYTFQKIVNNYYCATNPLRNNTRTNKKNKQTKKKE